MFFLPSKNLISKHGKRTAFHGVSTQVPEISRPAALSNHVRHVVHSRRFSGKELGCFYGTLGEDFTGLGGMLKRNHLVPSGKHDVMLTDDGAAPHGLKADFLRIPLGPSGRPVILIVIFVV